MRCAIEVDAVSKSFETGSRWSLRGSRRQVPALSEVNLHVAVGEVFGLVGRNGYGKTTLLKCICALLEPTRGTVRVFGHDVVQAGAQVRRCVGYVSADERVASIGASPEPTKPGFLCAPARASQRPCARRRIGVLAERFDVSPLLERRFFEYSTGNRQRLALVRALLHEPTVLVLDEPTRSLDAFAAATLRRTLVEWVREDRGRCVLITSHNLAEVEQLSQRVGIMTRGRLAEVGTLEALRTRFDDREHVKLWLDRAPDAPRLRALR